MSRWRDDATVVLSLALVLPLVLAPALLPPAAPDVVAVGGDAGAVQPTAIDACTTIDAPGTYVLVRDIVDDRHTRLSQACIVIEADGVVLAGRGHLVDGRGISDTTGVLVRNASEVVVRDLRVTDWNRGVYFDGVHTGVLVDVDAAMNARGLDLDRSREVVIEGGNVTANLIGIDLVHGDRNVTIGDGIATDNRVVDVARSEG